MNVSLIGYRGTGKSAVAQQLSARLGRPWVDLDDELETQHDMSISDIFAAHGEAVFREWEAEVVRQVARRQNWIIATGGGVILNPDNGAALKQTGPVVWLTARPATIHERLSKDACTSQRRPPLTNLSGLAEIVRLLEERQPLYRQAADLEVMTDDKSTAEVAAEILTWLCEQRGFEAIHGDG